MRDLWRPLAIMLLSGAGMVFQIAVTRLASAALDYHMTFLVISAALLGAAAGGTWVAVWLPASACETAERARLQVLALAMAGSLALTPAVFCWLPMTHIGRNALLLVVLGAYPLAALPYVFGSAALIVALRSVPARTGGLYAADLGGAAGGGLLALLTAQLAGPLWACALAACVAALAAVAAHHSRRRLIAGAAAVLIAGGAALSPPALPSLLTAKPLAGYLDTERYPGAALLHSRWDAFSRVDAFAAPGAALLWQVGSPSSNQPLLPDVLGMTIDADALTAVARADGGEPLAAASRLPESLAYVMEQRQRVLVIGPGGGVDVAAALHYGAQRVDAVEVSRAIVALMLGPLASYSGGLYRRPGVNLYVDEGRSFVRRRADRYDAIVLTAVDSWAALASGAYSLSENYLYTREAMRDYYDHLDEGGALVISRWYRQPPREIQRLAVMAQTESASRGVDPNEATILLRAGEFGTLLLRRGAVSLDQREKVAVFARTNGFTLEPLPTAVGRGAVTFPDPATDERPFFFDFVRWRDVLSGHVSVRDLPLGHAVLLVTLLQAASLTCAAVLLPLRRLRPLAQPRMLWQWGLYFTSIGVGFMLAEMALLQRMTLFLGHPALSLAVTLPSLLAGAALGSAAGGRWLRRRAASLGPLAACALLLACRYLLPPILAAQLAAPLGLRIAATVAMILLPAAPMGTALPAGLRRVSARGATAAAWAWGVNGAASAVGAVVAIMLSMEAGTGGVLVAAAVCYAVAGTTLAIQCSSMTDAVS